MSIIAILFALVASPTPARAAPDHVLLARIAVSESSWITPSGSNRDEAAILYLVLADRSRRQDWTLREAMQRYSPRATGVWRSRRTARQRWVSTLNEETRAPASWPTGLPWDDFRPRWERRLAEAAAILADPPAWPDHCDRPVHHWGGAMDVENPRRYGWVRARCGRMHNYAWCAPGLDREMRCASR